MGTKKWGALHLHMQLKSKYINVPERSHAQPCDHGQSNYSNLNVCFCNSYVVTVVTPLTTHLESQS